MKLTSIGYYTINVELDQDRFQIFVTVANNGSKTEVMEQAQKENGKKIFCNFIVAQQLFSFYCVFFFKTSCIWWLLN